MSKMVSTCPVSVLSFARPGERGYKEREVRAEFGEGHNRATNERLESRIDAAWTEALVNHPGVFNKSKFRLAHLDVKSEQVTFHLGMTMYKDFVGTNCLPKSELLQWEELGNKKFGDKSAYLANPLGVGALLHTADDLFVFLRRSQETFEAKGLLDRPGGHPEPDKILVPEKSSEVLVREIFSSVVEEIEDEVGISRQTLGPPEMIGIGYNKTTAGRPSLEFYVDCSLTSKQIDETYSKGEMPEKYESVGIVFLTEEQLRSTLESSSGTDTSHLNGPDDIDPVNVLSPSTIGSLMIYCENIM